MFTFILRKEGATITLQSYDRHFTPIGSLVSAADIARTRRTNADYTLSFTVPMPSADYREKLPLKGHVEDERGQFYVINSRKRARDGRKLTAAVSCSHVMYKLADYKFPYASYIREAYGIHITQLTALISAATGGRFSISVDSTFDLVDVRDFGGGNCLEALNAVITMYGAEVEPDNFTLHLRKKIGDPASDLQYRVGKNIVSSTFTDDGASLCTRLFAEMKDSRTWVGQPASILTAEEQALLLAADPNAIADGKLTVNYLISANSAAWSSASVPYYDDTLTEQDVTDPLKLLEAARLRLAERSVPALEVTVSAADLHKLDGTEPRPDLGDTVALVDPEMELTHTTARITELTEYPFDRDKHTSVTVANVMRRDYAQIIADLESGRRAVEQVFSGGRIRAEAFEEFARLAVHDINNSKTELIYPPEGGILAQDKTDSRNQVRLTSAGLGISTDGWQTVRSAITARGVVAEQVIGQLGNFVSMVIGADNNVVKINTNGISAGHDDYNSAPFRLDMAGNLIANSLTANRANILSSNFTDGAIVGSSINVGSGRFTVSSSGDVYAEGGIFSGGAITGAKIQTSNSVYPRVVIDPSSVAFGVYADENNGILIPAYDEGVSRIRFLANGNESTIYNSPSIGMAFSAYGNATISGTNIDLQPGAGRIRIPSWSDLFSTAEGASLRGELDALWSALSNKASINHSHTVSLGSHNHGIAGAVNWGGTFGVY